MKQLIAAIILFGSMFLSIVLGIPMEYYFAVFFLVVGGPFLFVGIREFLKDCKINGRFDKMEFAAGIAYYAVRGLIMAVAALGAIAVYSFFGYRHM